MGTSSRIVDAGCVVMEGLKTVGHIVAAARVRTERLKTRSCIFVAIVFKERLITAGRVADAGCVAIERLKTYCRVVGACFETEEGAITLGGVLIRVASVRRRARELRSSRWRKRKASEHERDEKKCTP